MAAWKVGMRARVVRLVKGPNPGPPIESIGSPIGKTGTIIGIPAILDGYDCSFMPDDYPLVGTARMLGYAVMFAALEPLLPPDEKAEAFIARMKKLGSEPVNDAPKVTVREGK